MPPTLPRAAGLAAATSLLLIAGTALPLAAADSPEAAVNGLFDVAESGDFSNLETVVCAADQASVREAFDFGASLGLADDDPAAGALSIEISDREVQLLAEDGDEATVRVTASLSLSVADDQLEDLVREHAADPQALADALVAGASADEAGYRDDATAIVLLRTAG